MKKISFCNTAVIIITFIMGLVFLFPIYWMVRTSFMGLKEMFAQPPVLFPTTFDFKNYTGAISNIKFLSNLLNSLSIVIPVVAGTLITSSFAAFAFSRLNFPGKKVWFTLIISTMMLPSAVTLIPQFTMWHKLKLIGTFMPLVVPAWFGGGAFFIFLIRQFMLSIPKEIDEAAKIDGAGYLRLFFTILMPNIKPALIVVALFTFVNTWNEFFYTLIYLNGKEELFTLTLALYTFKGVHQSDFSQIMALTSLVSIPTLIFFFIGNRYFVEGIATTGIKG